MAEKRKPTYDLSVFKETFNEVAKLNVTTTAVISASEFGFNREDIVTTLQSMRREHFFKSMTSYRDFRLWQDVYHVPSSVGCLYIKFTADMVTKFLLLSFKEKDNG